MCLCVRDRGTVGEDGGGGAGRVPCSESMPQIVVRCRSPSAVRFGQEGNVIGFVQSSWQPAPADICSLLTTQTYLHQGTHTHTHTVTQNRHVHTPIHTVTHTQPHAHTHNHTSACEEKGKAHSVDDLASCLWANFVIMESSVCQWYVGCQ